MSDFMTNQNDEVTHASILLGHYKKIMDLSAVEFRGGYWDEKPSGNSYIKTYIPDSRASYTNAVEQFANALYPYFDEEAKKAWDKWQKDMKSLTEEYESKKIGTEDGRRKRLEFAKVLFRELTCLLHRLDFFKTISISEGEEFNE